MANPLKMLKLKPTGIQMVHEMPITAAPAKVWKSLLNIGAWFIHDPTKPSKHTLELKPGAKWISENADGSMVHMSTVVYFEPGKLLRLCGQMGMTHVPVTTVIIFELQPENGGSKTLLRVGTRMFGSLLPEVKKMYRDGWNHYLPKLKALAES